MFGMYRNRVKNRGKEGRFPVQRMIQVISALLVNGYLIGFVFFIVPFLLTQVMMNNAVWNIFVPICILTCKTLGCNPLGPVMLVISGSLTAFMTPLATPAVAMVMNGGGYDVKTLLKMSILPAVLICILSVGWIMTYFPAY